MCSFKSGIFTLVLGMMFSLHARAETCNVCVSGTMTVDQPLILKTFKNYGYTVDQRSGDRAYCVNSKNADYSLQFDWIGCSGNATMHCGVTVHNNATGGAVAEFKKGTNGVYEALIDGHRADQLVRNVLALLKPQQTDLVCRSNGKENTRLSKEMPSSGSSKSEPKSTEVKSNSP